MIGTVLACPHLILARILSLTFVQREGTAFEFQRLEANYQDTFQVTIVKYRVQPANDLTVFSDMKKGDLVGCAPILVSKNVSINRELALQ
jgi:hypothetical protein